MVLHLLLYLAGGMEQKKGMGREGGEGKKERSKWKYYIDFMQVGC